MSVKVAGPGSDSDWRGTPGSDLSPVYLARRLPIFAPVVVNTHPSFPSLFEKSLRKIMINSQTDT